MLKVNEQVVQHIRAASGATAPKLFPGSYNAVIQDDTTMDLSIAKSVTAVSDMKAAVLSLVVTRCSYSSW